MENCKGYVFSEAVYKNLEKTPYIGYLYTNDSEAEFSYEFDGTEMGIYTNFSNYLLCGKGMVAYSIDGEAYKTVICSVHNPTIIVKDLPSEPHRITIKPLFSEDTPDKFEIIAVFSRDGEKATVRSGHYLPNVFV